MRINLINRRQSGPNETHRPLWLNHCDDRHGCLFPDATLALNEPDGLLAIGGNLEPETLINAYRNGIFPWYSDGQPILWWSPERRAVLFPDELKVSRSLKKTIRKIPFTITLDTAFDRVIRECATRRRDGGGTWITAEMIHAYEALHERGIAHSVEAWQNGALVGGLYGVALGRVFFGESMFHRVTDASKVAFATLVRQLQLRGFGLIDCQIMSAHLGTLGARAIQREEFLVQLRRLCATLRAPGKWQLDDYGTVHGLTTDAAAR